MSTVEHVWVLTERDCSVLSVHPTALAAMCQQSAVWKQTDEAADEWESEPVAGGPVLCVNRFEVIP